MPLEPCYIFDLDGTLADDTHRAHHMREGDWDTYFDLCEQDVPFQETCAVARSLHKVGFSVFIVTGRNDTVRPKTEQWLHKAVVPYSGLFMRKNGDLRSNSTIKLEVLKDLVEKHYQPMMVFEDNPHVVVSLRNAGYPCALIQRQADYVEYPLKATRT